MANQARRSDRPRPAPVARKPRGPNPLAELKAMAEQSRQLKPGQNFVVRGSQFTAGKVPIFDVALAIAELGTVSEALVFLAVAVKAKANARWISARTAFLAECDRRGLDTRIT